jgi:hypothetical protein
MLARINRTRSLRGHCIRTERDGCYTRLDFKRSLIIAKNVEPMELANELGFLHRGARRVERIKRSPADRPQAGYSWRSVF